MSSHQTPSSAPGAQASELLLQKRQSVADRLGMSSAALHRFFNRAINRLLAEERLTCKQFILMHQIQTFGPMAQGELAELLGIEAQTLVKQLDAMERDGWVRRAPDVLDRRIKRVEIAGPQKKMARAQDKFRQLQLASLEDFSEEELDTYLRLHQKMSASLTAFAQKLETQDLSGKSD